MNAALKHFLKVEWSMGHGQCETCGGCNPKPGMFHHAEKAGHRRSCSLAKGMVTVGGKPVWAHKNPNYRPSVILEGGLLTNKR